MEKKKTGHKGTEKVRTLTGLYAEGAWRDKEQRV